MNIKSISILCFAALLVGCVEQEAIPPAIVRVEQTQLENARFHIVIVAEFYDPLAYGGKRRIYEITDNKTKRTYLSVTGMGLDRLRDDEDKAEAVSDALAEFADSMSD